MRRFTTRQAVPRLLAGFALTIVVLALPPRPAHLEGPIFAFNLVGYLAAFYILALFILPLRRRVSWLAPYVTLPAHRRIGIAALILSGSHAIGYLCWERAALRFLLPSAPLYMMAGSASLLILGYLTFASFKGRDRSSRAVSARFRLVHLLLSVLTISLLTLHLVGSGLLLNASWKAVLWAALAALLALSHVRRPQLQPSR